MLVHALFAILTSFGNSAYETILMMESSHRLHKCPEKAKYDPYLLPFFNINIIPS